MHYVCLYTVRSCGCQFFNKGLIDCFYLGFLLFQNILLVYYVTVFVDSLIFYQDGMKFSMKVSVKILMTFSW